jgi:hypothetical protein
MWLITWNLFHSVEQSLAITGLRYRYSMVSGVGAPAQPYFAHGCNRRVFSRIFHRVLCKAAQTEVDTKQIPDS